MIRMATELERDHRENRIEAGLKRDGGGAEGAVPRQRLTLEQREG